MQAETKNLENESQQRVIRIQKHLDDPSTISPPFSELIQSNQLTKLEIAQYNSLMRQILLSLPEIYIKDQNTSKDYADLLIGSMLCSNDYSHIPEKIAGYIKEQMSLSK